LIPQVQEKTKWIGKYEIDSHESLDVSKKLNRIWKDLKSNTQLDFKVHKGASLNLFFEDISDLVLDINITLEENASCNMYGYSKNSNTKTHVMTNVFHQGCNSICEQDFRFVNKDNGTSSFKGLITIPKNVSGCESYMLNKNLLLDRSALAHSKPELDIRNSQTICTHGSTTSSIDEEQKFYLQSRGIGKKECVDIISNAFCEAVKVKYSNKEK
jgi:hypothetical protein